MDWITSPYRSHAHHSEGNHMRTANITILPRPTCVVNVCCSSSVNPSWPRHPGHPGEGAELCVQLAYHVTAWTQLLSSHVQILTHFTLDWTPDHKKYNILTGYLFQPNSHLITIKQTNKSTSAHDVMEVVVPDNGLKLLSLTSANIMRPH